MYGQITIHFSILKENISLAKTCINFSRKKSELNSILYFKEELFS